MTRLSPLSVPYRAVQRSASIAFALAFLAFTGGTTFGGFLGGLGAVALVGVVVVAIAGYELAYFRRFEYELTPDTLDIRSGVFSRRNREIPYRRIQNVDISRNVAQRLVGIAAVDLETAGGGETEGSLRFVSYEEARRIQSEVARLKRGGTDGDASEPEQELLFELTPRELAIVGALSFDLRLPGLVFVFGSTVFPIVASYVDVPVPAGSAAAAGVGIVALVLLVALVSWAAGFASAVVNYYGFRLSRVGDELQYERGLLQRYNGSIPLDKLQTLTVEDNPLKRRFGYATLLVETAGYAPSSDGTNGSGGGGRGSEAAIPLATRDRVLGLVADLEGVELPTFEGPPTRIRRRYAVRYSLVLGGATLALYGADRLLPQEIPWFVPLALVPVAVVAGALQWRHRGYALTEDHIVTRNGFWKRETRFVPYYRVQTVIERRTIFQRRWRVSTVTADTAGSISLVGGDATAVDIEVIDAAELRETLNDRLREALSARREARQQSRHAALGIRAAEPDRDADASDSVAVTDAEADVSQTPEFVEEAEPAAAGGDADAEDAADTGDTDDADTDDNADTEDDADEPARADDPFIWGESVESEGEDDEDADDPDESSDERDAI
ncbi:PH domain-containing protein [Haloferax volcanii]|uniref:PH domain-containing protein n=1 Tax=Haloferax volcanii TaxID=2246 RepID=UPI00249AF31C|nr:PH domain-containing protein [Haloferax alexandrinus]WEL29040.1 putative membrane protein, contains bPH2 domain [Haloferax alexandrinus]